VRLKRNVILERRFLKRNREKEDEMAIRKRSKINAKRKIEEKIMKKLLRNRHDREIIGPRDRSFYTFLVFVLWLNHTTDFCISVPVFFLHSDVHTL